MKRRESMHVFTLLVYAFLGVVWYTAVNNGYVARGFDRVAFTALLLLSGVLHGLLGFLVKSAARAVVYLSVQAVLAVSLVVLANGYVLAAAVLFPVAGQMFGLLTGLKARLIGLAAMAAAWAAGLVISGGWPAVRVQLPGAAVAFAIVATYVTLFARQLQERQRAEQLLAQLEDAHRQLRAYDARLEELTIAQERQRMARELHDTLAQGLAGIIMQMDSVDELLERGDAAKARTIMERARHRARTALADARAVIQALRTPLDDLSVIEAIRRQVEVLRTDTGIACALEIGPGDVELEGELGRQVLRIAQEGLANVAKHARATQAIVHLSAGSEQIELAITDDGVGFDPTEAVGQPGHFGLTGLQERVRLAGGELQVESSPGRGTRLHARLPREV